MTNTPIEMSEDEFDDQYPLLANHLNPHASWAFGDGRGCLFETYGEELEFIRQQDPRTVWTFVDGDDGGQYLLSGYHFVNRIGYLVSTVGVPEGADIEVRIPMQDEPEDELTEPMAGHVPDQRLSQIAREHLGIATLATRGSDSLDFHDLAVWQLEAALKAAFEAGAKTATLPTTLAGLPTPYDAYEIHGMKRLAPRLGQEEEPVGRVIDDCEQVPDSEAGFWSLFGHIPGQGLDCIGDFATREQAEEVFARITGRRYADDSHATTSR
jgi:Family of unknown function (DUF6900)